MKNSVLFLLLLFLLNSLNAQNVSVEVTRNGIAPLAGELDLNDPALQDWEPHILTVAEQKDGFSKIGNSKQMLDEKRRQFKSQGSNSNSFRSGTASSPVMLNNFTANNAQGTPNDNHIAISNDGKIVSVVNTNFRVYDEGGNQLQSKTLATFANSLGILLSISDPRVIYDPLTDRFIVIFFAGTSSASTKIVVAFSKTNDPAAAWNIYALNGNSQNDTTWSDYPIVSISDKDLFMTFNHLKDNEGWQTGFRYSAIWQIDKQKGYDGDTLQFNYWHNILHNGKPIWSVCPIHGGSLPSGPETYFLSVRPGDLTNDTLFLHTITNSYQSGTAQFSTKVLKTNVAYGLPPNAWQRDGQYLATNDARVLDGFIENDKIQYVQNTIDPQTMTAAIYVGEVDAPGSANPVVTGQIISYDTVDFGYPSIAYVGNNAFDNRAMISASFSSPDTFPGTCVFYKDANGNFSDMLIIKQGERGVNVLADTIERWGDYTGIQRKYNEPNTAWLAGSYVYPSQAYRTWIAKVVNPDSSVVSSFPDLAPAAQTKVFPNPASEKFSVEIELPKENYTRFALYHASGKLVRVLLEDRIKTGVSVFSFNTQHLTSGIYFLQITNKGELLKTERVVINR
ncbi:MAG: T9SS type A sorting domain-containing protein [Chitinophagales bacterium]|nr:T9SS type A sorting domain-containing protein [Chitinophagales bacterium]